MYLNANDYITLKHDDVCGYCFCQLKKGEQVPQDIVYGAVFCSLICFRTFCEEEEDEWTS